MADAVKVDEKVFCTLDEVGDGAFLVYDPASQGTLFLVWSKTSVDGCLAHVKASLPVPAHKYKSNNGRTEIFRNIQAQHQNYYQGWCSFIKTGKQFKSVFKLLNDKGPKDVQVILRKGNNEIEKALIGRPYELSEFEQVAVVPGTCFDFKAKTMTDQQLTQTAGKAGGTTAQL